MSEKEQEKGLVFSDNSLNSIQKDNKLPPIKLNSLENSRRTLGKLIRARARGEITDADYRALCYGLQLLVQYWRLDIESEVFDIIDTIDDRLSELEDGALKKRGFGAYQQ